MNVAAGFLRACHPGPAAAVTVVITALAWSVGWRFPGIALLLVAVLIGQLSVGWSNDAFDAGLDARSGRRSKPTVAAQVTARALWFGAAAALVVSSVLSLIVAGVVGGAFHVFALGMAWLYNLRLSRTAWSWLPYALAFGAVPAFVTYGFDGQPPPWWTPVCFAIIGVSAHLANALPDLDSDTEAGMGGLAVRLGLPRSVLLCWTLLAAGTAILVVVTARSNWLVSASLVIITVGSIVIGSRSTRPTGMFEAIIGSVVVDVVAVILVS